MAKLNGTLLLLNADGVDIAAQKNCTLNVSQNLFDTTNKESAGWAEHGNGLRNYTVDFDALASTTGISAKELLDYIITRRSLLLVLNGISSGIIMEVSLASGSVNGPMEDATTLSGQFVGKGNLYVLSAAVPNLVTDWTPGGNDYDTFTVNATYATKIDSAINAAGSAYCNSNTIGTTDTYVYKVFMFLTLNSGQAPTVGLWDNTSAFISNTVALTAGINVITLTATATDATASLRFTNSGAGNWATSIIYLFKP